MAAALRVRLRGIVRGRDPKPGRPELAGVPVYEGVRGDGREEGKGGWVECSGDDDRWRSVAPASCSSSVSARSDSSLPASSGDCPFSVRHGLSGNVGDKGLVTRDLLGRSRGKDVLPPEFPFVLVTPVLCMRTGEATRGSGGESSGVGDKSR